MLKSSDNQEAAQTFVEFLLSEKAQEYFADHDYEYPLAGEATPDEALPADRVAEGAGDRPQRPRRPAGLARADARGGYPALTRLRRTLRFPRFRLPGAPEPTRGPAARHRRARGRGLRRGAALARLPRPARGRAGLEHLAAAERSVGRRGNAAHGDPHRHRDGGCIALAVPLAWLTARTDLPFRRALDGAAGAAAGDALVRRRLRHGQRARSGRDAAGPPRAAGRRAAPLALRLLGRLADPDAVLVPVRLPDHARGAAALRSRRWKRRRGASARPRRQTFVAVNLPLLRPAIAAGALLVALYVLSEFGAVSMLRYDTLTPLVYIQYTTSFDRSAAAVVGLPLLLLAVLIVVIEPLTRGRARYHASAQARPAADGAAGPMAVAGDAVLRARRAGGDRHPGRRDRLLARPGAERGRVDAAALGGGRQLRASRRVRGDLRGGSPRCRSRCSRCATPAGDDGAREARLPRAVAAGDHDRPVARVLRGELHELALPDVRAPDLRVRGALPARGARRESRRRCSR